MKAFRVRTICSLATAAALAAVALFPTGCDMNRNNDAGLAEPEFSVNASAKEVMVGEIVTLTTRSANLVGRDMELEWFTTGGELTTEENDRVARVRFDRPGTYTVSSRLTAADDDYTYTDSVNITVRPLNLRK